MLRWWYTRALVLQDAVRSEEASISMDYDAEVVRRATVHGREDLVLIVSYLSSANVQLWHLKFLLFLNLIALTYVGYSVS